MQLWKLSNCYFVQKYIYIFLLGSKMFIYRKMYWMYMNVQFIGVWWWVFSSRSAFKVTPEVFQLGLGLGFNFHVLNSVWILNPGPHFTLKIKPISISCTKHFISLIKSHLPYKVSQNRHWKHNWNISVGLWYNSTCYIACAIVSMLYIECFPQREGSMQ